MSELIEDRILSGRFRLQRLLGRGAAGEVWLAEDTDLGQPVALKILNVTIAGDAAQVELLRTECLRARALVHPNILRCHDFHSDDDVHFITMQYVPGGDLTALRGAAFQKVVAAALMLCDALDYAHRQGVVHRDIKPANVLVDERGESLLGDFGLAASLDNSAAGRTGGTLPYMSPQQLDGEAPAVADDVYGLGALLYELLAGVPPLHPDATVQRIRTEPPAALSEDGTGQALPPALIGLVAAMLDKSAAARPAGIGAVRAVLEEIRQDHPSPAVVAADVIKPVRRQSAPRRGLPADVQSLPSAPPPGRSAQGLPAGLVVGGLAVLALLVVGVVFLLPSLVDQQGPLVDRARPEPPRDATPAAEDPASAAAQRKLADAALADLLPLEDQLKALGVEQWGGADWTAALNTVEIGDEAYRDRDFASAAAAYRQAQAMGEALVPKAATVLADALAAGEAALLDGDQLSAIAQYQLALAVDAGNQTALDGLSRAEKLDELLAAMAEATRLETSGEISAAAEAYQAALVVDPDWSAAEEGLSRTRAVVNQRQYETQMAAGYAALSEQKFARARGAFQSALRVRPGDKDASGALRQLGAEERLESVLVYERQARELEAAERWSEAAKQYESALAVDAGLVSARQGLARSQARTQLGRDIEKVIAQGDRFYEPEISRRARAVLERAIAAQPPGPQLSARASELRRLLEESNRTVSVRFSSDNLTQVTIYKVGRLGNFDARVVELRPGRYIAVGSRDGYRDVRREFRVLADGSSEPIVVRCEEPI
jgi:tetratricopeptide (TPR) repeat protein